MKLLAAKRRIRSLLHDSARIFADTVACLLYCVSSERCRSRVAETQAEEGMGSGRLEVMGILLPKPPPMALHTLLLQCNHMRARHRAERHPLRRARGRRDAGRARGGDGGEAGAGEEATRAEGAGAEGKGERRGRDRKRHV